MIDLHSHSTASDGKLSPSKLVDLAADTGLKALALTDHDTTAGLAEAGQKALERGLIFIPGIEMEITHADPGIFHLLGLGIVEHQAHARELLEAMKESRESRNQAMVKIMQDDGIEVEIGDVKAMAGGQIISRPHFADVLVKLGRARSRQDAFDRYLAVGKPYYQTLAGTDFSTACDFIHRSGGLAIMAHPLSIYISWSKLDTRFSELKSQGLDGIEAWHPGVKFREAQRLEGMAKDHGLVVSAGSDYHGEHRLDRVLGRTAREGHRIDDRFLDIFDLKRHSVGNSAS